MGIEHDHTECIVDRELSDLVVTTLETVEKLRAKGKPEEHIGAALLMVAALSAMHDRLSVENFGSSAKEMYVNILENTAYVEKPA